MNTKIGSSRMLNDPRVQIGVQIVVLNVRKQTRCDWDQIRIVLQKSFYQWKCIRTHVGLVKINYLLYIIQNWPIYLALSPCLESDNTRSIQFQILRLKNLNIQYPHEKRYFDNVFWKHIFFNQLLTIIVKVWNYNSLDVLFRYLNVLFLVFVAFVSKYNSAI